MAFHKDLTGYDIHIIYAWEYPNITARETATGFVTVDVGKLARQIDNNTFWVLTAVTPVWAPIASSYISDWGSISGILSNQTDLQNALDNKTNAGHLHIESNITDLDHTDLGALHKTISAEISSLTEKNILTGADLILIEDSADSYSKKYAQVGNLIFGSQLHYGSNEEVSATTNQSFQQKLRITTSDLPSGTYFIKWYYEISSDANPHSSRIEINDVEEIGGRFFSGTQSDWVPITGFVIKSAFSGIKNLDIDWRSEKPGWGTSIRRARLILWRIS